jgi:predicted branched-subunit amino acid permease
MLWTQVGLHAGWATGALLGGLVGASFLSGVEGLDFVLTALFVILAIDVYKASRDRVALTLAVSCAVIAAAVAPGSMLLVAMSMYALALVLRHHAGKNHQETTHA